MHGLNALIDLSGLKVIFYFRKNITFFGLWRHKLIFCKIQNKYDSIFRCIVYIITYFKSLEMCFDFIFERNIENEWMCTEHTKKHHISRNTLCYTLISFVGHMFYMWGHSVMFSYHKVNMLWPVPKTWYYCPFGKGENLFSNLETLYSTINGI